MVKRCPWGLSVVAEVRRAIPVFVAHEWSPDDVLGDALIADGRSRVEAERMLIFVPIAFGRALLSETGIRFSATYLLHSSSGEPMSKRLLAQPIFYAAMAVAGMGLDRDTVLAIARRSAEFKVVTQALNDGCRAAALILTEPLVSLPGEDPETQTDTGQSTAKAPPVPAPSSKGWLARILGR
jgi:hypothetical protein